MVLEYIQVVVVLLAIISIARLPYVKTLIVHTSIATEKGKYNEVFQYRLCFSYFKKKKNAQRVEND